MSGSHSQPSKLQLASTTQTVWIVLVLASLAFITVNAWLNPAQTAFDLESTSSGYEVCKCA